MYVHPKSFTPLADESVQDMFNQDSNPGYLVGRYVSLVHVGMGEANEQFPKEEVDPSTVCLLLS